MNYIAKPIEKIISAIEDKFALFGRIKVNHKN